MQGYKFFTILSFSLLFLVNCQSYGEIKVEQDSFKNAKVVSMQLDHKSEETFGLFNMKAPIVVTYIKEVKSGAQPTIEMKIIAPADATSQLKPDAFIKADEQKFEVKLTGIDKTSATHSHTKNKRDTKGNVIDTETKTSTEYASIANLTVSPEIWKRMVGAQKLGYRLYIDQQALTFMISEEWMEKLKEFDQQ